MAFLKRLFVPLLLAALVPGVGAAQSLSVSKIDMKTPAPAIRIPSRLPDLVPARTRTGARSEATQQTSRKRKARVMGFAIAAGIGAGVAVAGVAASKYGENEGSCGRCFVEWSAIAIPVGAGVGAAVGYLIDRARR